MMLLQTNAMLMLFILHNHYHYDYLMLMLINIDMLLLQITATGGGRRAQHQVRARLHGADGQRWRGGRADRQDHPRQDIRQKQGFQLVLCPRSVCTQAQL